MLIRILHRTGLTDLSSDEVEQYEKAINSGAKIAEVRKIQFLGLLSLSLVILLVFAAIKMIPLVHAMHNASNAGERLVDISRLTSIEAPEPTRGGTADPAQTLSAIRARVKELQSEMAALRLQSIDYHSLKVRQKRLAAINRELEDLWRRADLARKQLGVG